ncbi:hypothetical protein EPN83_00360 [Patescibacteria group bacterium]|nr:MAG: hypothetical protein EPN83_00360 [Patescibacteria group bacterium]
MYFQFFHSKYRLKWKRAYSVFLIMAVLFAVSPFKTSVLAEGEEEISVPPADSNTSVETPEAQAPELAAEESQTTIETGDATAESDTQNTVNVNETTTASSTPAEDTAPELTGESVAEEENSQSDSQPPLSVEVTNENVAEAENDVSTEANTGENEAQGNQNVLINAGSALASANVVNVINVNIANSSGFLAFLNNFLTPLGTLDLRSYMANPENSAGLPCGAECGSLSGLLVSNSNQAVVSNQVAVSATTGGNSATSTDGAATVLTGNAYAAANVVNLVNTNITLSNYYLLVLNSFGDWNGHLVFPNANFFDLFFGGQTATETADQSQREGGEESVGTESEGESAEISVSNDNQASVSNTASVSADTGSNTAVGADAVVETGRSYAGTTVMNFINTNLFGGGSFSLIVRVYGEWNGAVYNLPQSISVDASGGAVTFSGNSGSGSTTIPSSSISNTNSATVNNAVSVSAATGGNSASGGAATISTGNAYAASNLINAVNTNIFSHNWAVAIVNIFGNWNGSLSFGAPDLWVGAVAQTTNAISRGDPLTFYLTVANRGDVEARNVTLNMNFDKPYISLIGQSPQASGYLWNLGNIAPKSSIEFSYPATVGGDLPMGDTPVIGYVSVAGDGLELNTGDNQDQLTVIVSTPLIFPVSFPSDYIPRVSTTFDIKKSAEKTTTVASSTVKYTIVVANNGADGATAKNAVLHDVLKSPSGEIIHEQDWELGDVYGREEVTVDYDVVFNRNITPGVYTNHAQLKSDNGSSPIASASITVLAPTVAEEITEKTIETLAEAPLPEVAGASEEAQEVLKYPINTLTLPRYEQPRRNVTWGDILAAVKEVFSKFTNSHPSILFSAVIYFSLLRRQEETGLHGFF